jgi:hypothetical protein
MRCYQTLFIHAPAPECLRASGAMAAPPAPDLSLVLFQYLFVDLQGDLPRLFENIVATIGQQNQLLTAVLRINIAINITKTA